MPPFKWLYGEEDVEEEEQKTEDGQVKSQKPTKLIAETVKIQLTLNN